MNSAITAFFTALSEMFRTLTASKERQSETSVVKKQKNKDKAIDYAEKIIFMADETYLSDDRRYKYLRKQFFKFN